MKKFLPALILVASLNAASAEQFDKKSFSNFNIIHADKLNFIDSNTELIGGVEIEFNNKYNVKSPRVMVLSGEGGGEPNTISFEGGVKLSSSDLFIEADRIEVDFPQSLLKCYGRPNVLSSWGAEGQEPTTVISDYQEFNFDTGLASAFNQAKNEDGSIKQVEAITDDRWIWADKAELQSGGNQETDLSGAESIKFHGAVVYRDEDKRIQSNDLFFWVPEEMVKATEDVKVLAYSSTGEPVYLFADMAVLEQKKDIMSAFSNAYDKKAYVYSDEVVGQARKIALHRVNRKPDSAILTGDAYVKFQDKAMSGEEIYFDLKEKIAKSLVDRPTTTIFSSSSKKAK